MSDTAEKSGFKIETSSLRAYTMLGATALIWLFFYWQTDGVFLTPRNLSNLMLQMSVTGILAVGMLMVIVSGNIDLAVGSAMGLAGAIAAILLRDYGFFPAILGAVAVSIAIGAFHGLLTAYFNIPAFIVTLGGLLAWRGAIKGVTKSETIDVSNPNFTQIGQGYLEGAEIPLSENTFFALNYGWILAVLAIAVVLFLAFKRAKSQKEYELGEANYGIELIKSIVPIGAIIIFVFVMNFYKGVPVPVLILLAAAGFGVFITNSTVFGRYLYAIGGNTDAARLSGINTKLNILLVFALLGVFIGIASLVNTARLGSATVDAGVLKELDAIAACVIGGASLMGGRGTIFGACLGALIMESLDNGMLLMEVRDFMKDIVKGAVLVAAVGIDMIGKKS